MALIALAAAALKKAPAIIQGVQAIGSLISGSSAKKAAAEAARIQSGAATQAAYEARVATDAAQGRLEPYINAGNAADGYIYALAGLPRGTGSGAGGYGAGGSGKTRAQILEEWATGQGLDRAHYAAKGVKNAQYYPSYETFVEASIANNGYSADQIVADYEAAHAPEASTQQAVTEGAAGSYDAAMKAYEASPWAVQAKQGADTARKNANEAFVSTAGANGGLNSGRTAAGLYDIAQEAEDQRFREGFTQGWFPTIQGVSDRGYNAVNGSNSIQITGANATGDAAVTGANARADALLAGHDAVVSGINGALYHAGKAYDEATNDRPRVGTPTTKAPTTTAPRVKTGGVKTPGTAKLTYTGG